MSEIKPCPFCGGSVRTAERIGEGFVIVCHCGVEYSGLCATAEDLHRNWNRRAPDVTEPDQSKSKMCNCNQGRLSCDCKEPNR